MYILAENLCFSYVLKTTYYKNLYVLAFFQQIHSNRNSRLKKMKICTHYILFFCICIQSLGLHNFVKQEKHLWKQ